MDKDTEARVYKLVHRFSEPSSYAGLSALLGVAGISVPGSVMSNLALILSGICGLVAFFLPDPAKS